MSKKEEAKEEQLLLRHVLVPKHEVLRPKEAEAVLKKYSAKPEQLPYILSRDPVVKAIGAKAGDIIRITRKSDTAGETTYYRYVVEG